MGNLGLATSFFNDKNRNVCRDLLTLLTETKQVRTESSRWRCVLYCLIDVLCVCVCVQEVPSITLLTYCVYVCVCVCVCVQEVPSWMESIAYEVKQMHRMKQHGKR